MCPAVSRYPSLRNTGTATVHDSLCSQIALWQSGSAMTITYANGTRVQGIALVRTDGLMRVALRGCRDSVEFIAGANGTWLSESGEPVRIGEHSARQIKAHTLDEFICPQDVLSRLVGALQAA